MAKEFLVLRRLVFLFFLIQKTLSSDNPCLVDTNKNCDSCILTSYECGWCKDLFFSGQRCNKVTTLTERGCQEIENPLTKATSTNGVPDTFMNIQPSEVAVIYRPGGTADVAVTAEYKMDLPIELVFSMDFSGSMSNEWSEMKKLANRLTEMTTSGVGSKIGYTAFVDKTAFPIVSYSNYDERKIETPFLFKIISPLTSGSANLITKLDAEKISTNIDPKEASLEAVLQSAVCSKIGWSQKASVLKTILVLTDAGTKMAGDGKMVAIVEPHDGECHVDEKNFYRNGLTYDYPSVGLLGDILKRKKISVIFAVAGDYIAEYRLIAESWKGVSAIVTELKSGGTNVMEIIAESRKKFNSLFKFYYSADKDLTIAIKATCPSTATDVANDMCYPVIKDQSVTFDTSITFPETPIEDGSLTLSVSTFGTIPVTYSQIKKCPCSDAAEENSEKCSTHGTYKCGECTCDDRWSGTICNCSLSEQENKNSCTAPGTTNICSGQGTCECGTCSCYKGGTIIISGKYCECQQSQCNLFNNQICGGEEHGECDCNTCKCKPMYMGGNCGVRNCENPNWINSCIDPAIGFPCSGHGVCECGRCKCDNEFGGELCEKKTTPYICEDFAERAYCYLFNTTLKSKPCEFSDYLFKVEISTSETETNWECTLRDMKNCLIEYNYKIVDDKLHQVIVRPHNSFLDCPAMVNFIILAIVLFLVLVIIVILAVVGYLVARYLYDRHQYLKLEEEKQKTAFGGEVNPLYSAPVTDTANPLNQ